MARRLEDLQIPWLTREQLEAAIWRLTGARSQYAVEELLWAADVYAVSQGPRLASQLAETKRAQRRWLSVVPPDDEPVHTTSDKPDRPVREEPLILSASLAPRGSVPVRDGTSGLEQLCRTCDDGEGVWKLLSEFGTDSGRWNGKTGQCRACKNDQQRERVRARRARTGLVPRQRITSGRLSG